ncbi:hypothetical protein ANN_03205 [Periplaneta americana]|uniref:Mos1 transposase HTH domain-containing protein n=1 Tax=Periplaneta americana TaxID=6978 RepID=A0ABQ8TYC7_PERAM|nr:hypothetical protein ANN_03205 [Periplaneta americana]
MFKVLEHPADCEMRSVIRFLNARNIKPADIHRQLCEVYGDDTINDGMVRRWVRKFNEGRVSVHDEQRIGRPPFINDVCDQGDEFLDHIVTGDETLVNHMTPESKQQSMEWRHTASSRKKKLKQTMSTGKIMCTVFGTVKESYSSNSCLGVKPLIEKPILVTPKISSRNLAGNKLTIPTYRPDLAPSDFHLFLHLKKFLGGQRFDGDDEVKTAVREWFASQFYNEGIERLVSQLDKCHNNGGDYVEKYSVRGQDKYCEHAVKRNMLKKKFYANKQRTIQEKKENITVVIDKDHAMFAKWIAGLLCACRTQIITSIIRCGGLCWAYFKNHGRLETSLASTAVEERLACLTVKRAGTGSNPGLDWDKLPA